MWDLKRPFILIYSGADPRFLILTAQINTYLSEGVQTIFMVQSTWVRFELFKVVVQNRFRTKVRRCNMQSPHYFDITRPMLTFNY